jgi:hypothetical protein
MNLLTLDNFKRGYLIDEELMAGVMQDPEHPETYTAFVLRHTTGESLGQQTFPDLDSALERINQIPRPWTYEPLGGGCKGGQCDKGQCTPGACGLVKC